MTLLKAAIAGLDEGQAIKGERGYVAVPRSAIVALTEAVFVAIEHRPGIGLPACETPTQEEALLARFALVADAIEGLNG